jgi:hypothetical protein
MIPDNITGAKTKNEKVGTELKTPK